MTKDNLAAKLNGREYMHEITGEEENQAKESRLVVIFGASDNLMEFRGAVNDEIGWGTAYFTPAGLLVNECDDEDCPYFFRLTEACGNNKVVTLWGDSSPSWTYETKMPHSDFDIMDDGEVYCRGIIVELPPKEAR